MTLGLRFRVSGFRFQASYQRPTVEWNGDARTVGAKVAGREAVRLPFDKRTAKDRLGASRIRSLHRSAESHILLYTTTKRLSRGFGARPGNFFTAETRRRQRQGDGETGRQGAAGRPELKDRSEQRPQRNGRGSIRRMLQRPGGPRWSGLWFRLDVSEVGHEFIG